MGIVQNSLEVVKLAAKFANPELIERVTALNEQVLELSSKNVEFQEQVFQLEKQLQQANDKLRLIGETERREGFIYLKTEPEPCCPRCFDVDRVLVRIVKTKLQPAGYRFMCPECETVFAAYPKGLAGAPIS
ncbi:MAG: hypothetical protein LAO30_04395 [Acidobacteriia bacterium]|nr:hypothetical protein [Terriglobia bacterium]